MKGNKDMIRIVAIAAAFLVMFAIIGFSIYSINHINELNQRSRDKEQGESFASIIAQTTATTSAWDYIRSRETSTETTGTSDEISTDQGVPVNEAAPDAAEQTVTMPVSTEIVSSVNQSLF